MPSTSASSSWKRHWPWRLRCLNSMTGFMRSSRSSGEVLASSLLWFEKRIRQRSRLLQLISSRSQPKGPKWWDGMQSPPNIKSQEPADGESETGSVVKLEEVGTYGKTFVLQQKSLLFRNIPSDCLKCIERKLEANFMGRSRRRRRRLRSSHGQR